MNFLDQCCLNVDQILKTLCRVDMSARPSPGHYKASNSLNKEEKKEVAGLMRVNHAGEVCAQALYHGQSVTAKLSHVRQKMAQAAQEEFDHLAWCQQRLDELGSHTSYLNPVWYAGSFMIGALAGAVGDRWSLGFVAETERQVVSHLEKHLARLPQKDDKSRAVLETMADEEAEHRQMAYDAGAAELPLFVQRVMRGVSKVMTRTAYFL